MRHGFTVAVALGFALASGAAFAQDVQGGYAQRNVPDPAANHSVPPGPQTYSYGGSGGSGSTGVDTPTRETGGDLPSVGQMNNEGPTTDGVPGKVGGGQSSHHGG